MVYESLCITSILKPFTGWCFIHIFAPFHPGNWYDDPKSLVFLGWVETNN